MQYVTVTLTEAACFRAWLIISFISDRFLLKFSPSNFKGCNLSKSLSVRN